MSRLHGFAVIGSSANNMESRPAKDPPGEVAQLGERPALRAIDPVDMSESWEVVGSNPALTTSGACGLRRRILSTELSPRARHAPVLFNGTSRQTRPLVEALLPRRFVY